MIKINSYGPVTRFDLARSLPFGWRYWTTAYLVEGMLVDTGCAHAAPDLISALAGSNLQRIVNTHTHEDHIGANGPLQHERRDLEVLAHPLALPVLADPRRTQPLHPYRRLFWGWPEPCQAQPLSDGDQIETERYTFQVIYTPGHSRDHICLYEASQGWLFTGDLFVGGQDRALRAGHDIWLMIESLRRVADLPIQWLFPGSARVRQHPAQEIVEKITYLENTGERVQQMHRQGCSVQHITRALFGGPMTVEWVTMGHFSRRCLVLSYLNMNPDR
jgi:hydroxyacylglutathione hydrolase